MGWNMACFFFIGVFFGDFGATHCLDLRITLIYRDVFQDGRLK